MDSTPYETARACVGLAGPAQPLAAAHDLVAVLLEEQLAATARAVRLAGVVPYGRDRLGHGRVRDTQLLRRRLAGTRRDEDVPTAVAAEIAVELSAKWHGQRLQFHPSKRRTGPPCSTSYYLLRRPDVPYQEI